MTTATKPNPGQQLARVAPEHHLAHADPEELGALLARSQYFEDAQSAAQAAVKVLAGRELGISPIAAMTDVHIIEGKPSLGGNLLAGLVKASEKYDYRVARLDAEACVLDAFEDGEEVGEVSFTFEDAQAAELAGKKVWTRYRRNMLFNRAISNLVAWYCPDLTTGLGRVYVPEELGAQVDQTGAPVVDADGVVVMDPQATVQTVEGPEPQAKPPEPTRALLAANQRQKVTNMAKALEDAVRDALLHYFGGSPLVDRIERRYVDGVYNALGDPDGAIAYVQDRAKLDGDDEDARAKWVVERYLRPPDDAGGSSESEGDRVTEAQGELL